MIGKRGKLFARDTSLYAILPSNAPNASGISILRSTAAGHFRDWSVAWESVDGCVAEPLFDRYRLDTSIGDGVLSLFLVNGTSIEVLDMSVLC